MPKIAKQLSDAAVRNLHSPGTHAVGGVSGLLLQISPTGARSWLLRTLIKGRRGEIGLGSYPEVSLAGAREQAKLIKSEVRAGGDPIERKRQERLESKRRITFSEATKKYLATKLAEFRNEKHKAQWSSTIETYATPIIGNMAVSAIDVHDIQRVIQPIWLTKTETATRVRQRTEAILDWATVNGHRAGENPARWKGNLDAIMPKPGKVADRGSQPALQLKDVAAWFDELRKRDGTSARALEFLTMTAARSGEVRGMEWSEIDWNAKLWTVPASRMKMGREHRVPLTDDAIALLQNQPSVEGSSYVFAAVRGGQLSDMSLSAVMRRMHADKVAAGEAGWLDRQSKRPAVPHGLRSTFRDWAAEVSSHPQEMAELALAHAIGNKVEAAYRRGDMMEKRRAMMIDWNDYLESTK